MTEKLTPQELIYLDEAISEMKHLEKIEKEKQEEEGLEVLLRKREDIDNQILLYQIKHNMSGPFNINEILKIIKSN